MLDEISEFENPNAEKLALTMPFIFERVDNSLPHDLQISLHTLSNNAFAFSNAKLKS